MNTRVLSQLLTQGQRYAPDFAADFSNHLPMALIALHRLGAQDSRLLEFESGYASRLTRATVPFAIGFAGSSQILLGHMDAFYATRAQFLDELVRNGMDVELRKTLPVLLPGVGAAAFHGLIRTAYAIEASHTEELASGLAYWACRYLPLRLNHPVSGVLGVDNWAAHVEAQLSAWRSDKDLISERMLEVSQTQAFMESVDGLATGADTLQRLSSLAAERYLQTQDFTVLHLITSCHALRLLMPWIQEPDVAVRWYALAYAAGLLASSARGPYRVSTAPEPEPWKTITQRAIASDNDHVIKLVYTCRQEAAHYGDERYHQVAALAVSG
jgi:Questin oxidase-like